MKLLKLFHHPIVSLLDTKDKLSKYPTFPSMIHEIDVCTVVQTHDNASWFPSKWCNPRYSCTGPCATVTTTTCQQSLYFWYIAGFPCSCCNSPNSTRLQNLAPCCCEEPRLDLRCNLNRMKAKDQKERLALSLK